MGMSAVVFKCRAYESVYGLEIPKYRLITDPYLKKIQTKYGLYLTEIQTSNNQRNPTSSKVNAN